MPHVLGYTVYKMVLRLATSKREFKPSHVGCLHRCKISGACWGVCECWGPRDGQISGQILCASLAWPVEIAWSLPWDLLAARCNMNSVRIAALDGTWRGRVPGHGTRAQLPVPHLGGEGMGR